MYQRRIVDTQHRQPKRTVGAWPEAMIKASAIVLAVQIAAWFILAIADSPWRVVALMSMSQAGIVWAIVMAWAIKEMR